MSKSHRPVIDAFLENRKKKITNTETDGESLYLFGNRIAWWDEQNCLWITTSGYNTNTTRDRLNMLPDVWVRTSKGQLYLWASYINPTRYEDWLPWNGNAINITKLIFEKHNK